jgi:hypothetical protein
MLGDIRYNVSLALLSIRYGEGQAGGEGRALLKTLSRHREGGRSGVHGPIRNRVIFLELSGLVTKIGDISTKLWLTGWIDVANDRGG